ncbi:hypothetical protein EV207_107120 [Scopulibacillus darangshiensis]|uniref:Biotin/lipoyl-binding protein n=1 Tax=Scopulibacillus darangshiensis TaxID=442528 RepID=A0A4R2P874_9BACL|nr:hypothetical protein [Scopulibacillus darangshiensis]TCP30025.1 hypothetical protein EV207_107120 [Scopulibacillus darangshiensis]
MKQSATLINPYHGVVEKITIEKDERIYEWDPLFTIKTTNGHLETVRVGLCGLIDSLEVGVGDQVKPGMVLAHVNEDLMISGSD